MTVRDGDVGEYDITAYLWLAVVKKRRSVGIDGWRNGRRQQILPRIGRSKASGKVISLAFPVPLESLLAGAFEVEAAAATAPAGLSLVFSCRISSRLDLTIATS